MVEFKSEEELMNGILFTAHLLDIRKRCENGNSSKELLVLQAKQSISLLRYADILPFDQAFYDAGQYAKVISQSIN